MSSRLKRWTGPHTREVIVALECSECSKRLHADGVIVCIDHDLILCAACASSHHAKCSTEIGCGRRLLRQIEVCFLLDYLQFASTIKGNVSRWLYEGFQAKSTTYPDDRQLMLQLVAQYMSATEDLSILLDALRKRLVESPPCETLLETMLNSNKGQLPKLLDNCHDEIELSSFAGLEFIEQASIPGFDCRRLHDEVRCAIFRTAFGTQSDKPNWQYTRWRAYNKLKHGSLIISSAANVFGVSNVPDGTSVLDWQRQKSLKIPQVISFEIGDEDAINWVEQTEAIGVCQQIIIFCYMYRFHKDILIKATPSGDPMTILTTKKLLKCYASMKKIAPINDINNP